MTPQFIAGERRVPDIVEPFQRFCGGALSPDELPLAAGCIGRGPAVQYLAIRRAQAAVQDIDAILAAPGTAAIPARIDQVYAVACALIDRIRGESAGDVAERVVRYTVRLPDEIAAAAMRQLADKWPPIVTCQPYLSWAEQAAA